jgi:hypothetical protein
LVTEKSHVALPTYASQSLQIWLKSVSKEGHFTVVAERVFRPYLTSYFSMVTQTTYLALPAHAPQLVQVWSKLVNNQGHFTVEAETDSRP